MIDNKMKTRVANKEGKNTVSLGSTSIVNFFCWRSLNVSSMVTEPGRRKVVERWGDSIIWGKGRLRMMSPWMIANRETWANGWLAMWDA